jgi:pimeloyl-ACP methyl ester carboxylesterase
MSVRIFGSVRILGILVVLLSVVNAQEQPASSPIQSATQSCGAAVVEYFSQGQGEPVVLLPGSGFGVAYLEPLAEALARGGHRAVRINPRGAGNSTGSLVISYDDRAADVSCVVEALRLGPVHLVGHAFGNRIARTLAANRPDLVQSVTLLAAGGKVPGSPQAGAALARIYTQASDAELIEAVHVSGLVGSPSSAAQIWRQLKPSVFPESRPRGSAQKVEDWWAPAGRARFLVLQGLNDLIAPPENGRLLKQELGDRATLVEFSGVGHMVPLEEPEKTATAILSFLKTTASTTTVR